MFGSTAARWILSLATLGSADGRHAGVAAGEVCAAGPAAACVAPPVAGAPPPATTLLESGATVDPVAAGPAGVDPVAGPPTLVAPVGMVMRDRSDVSTGKIAQARR